MKTHIIITSIFICFFSISAFTQDYKTIHVFVALCDNEFQGIVPVPSKIGDGKDPFHNLYWGAGYGVKNYFHRKSDDWKLVKTTKNPQKGILERILFKHKTKKVYLLADAYDGELIKTTTEDFLNASSGNFDVCYGLDNRQIEFGGKANLIVYIGHDGLMDFDVDLDLYPRDSLKREVVILACYSKEYFSPHIKAAGAHPLVWTNGLMAPEAYTLEWALDGWVLGETNQQIRERAAKAYNHYQKCGMKGARWLLRTAW